MGIGDWGLGIGDWAQSPIPNPQSPIPNIYFLKRNHKLFINLLKLIIILNYVLFLYNSLFLNIGIIIFNVYITRFILIIMELTRKKRIKNNVAQSFLALCIENEKPLINKLVKIGLLTKPSYCIDCYSTDINLKKDNQKLITGYIWKCGNCSKKMPLTKDSIYSRHKLLCIGEMSLIIYCFSYLKKNATETSQFMNNLNKIEYSIETIAKIFKEIRICIKQYYDIQQLSFNMNGQSNILFIEGHKNQGFIKNSIISIYKTIPSSDQILYIKEAEWRYSLRGENSDEKILKDLSDIIQFNYNLIFNGNFEFADDYYIN